MSIFCDPVLIHLGIHGWENVSYVCKEASTWYLWHFKKLKPRKPPTCLIIGDQTDIFDTFINSVQELNESSELDLYFQMESGQKYNVEWEKQVSEHLLFQN